MRILVLFGSLLLASCSVSLKDYAATTPAFDLRSYFDGGITAWGIIEDYTGKMNRRFCVDIVGTWDDNKGQLHETFYYDDGEQQIRIWHLTVAEDGRITGTAADVIGEATGRTSGTAFNWKYVLEVPIDGTLYEFAIDDWMYMLDEQRIMNRSFMSKLGIEVAQISIFFDKTPPLRKCSA